MLSAKSSKDVFQKFLIILPCLLLFVSVIGTTTNLPWQDQWEFVSFLQKWKDHTLTFQDLWSQHNEHRLIFPRLVMLGLATVSDWNIAWEVGCNLVLAMVIFLILKQIVRKSFEKLKIESSYWLLPLISFFIFSLSQWENWTWGWQIQIFMNVGCVLMGAFLFSEPLTPRRLLLVLLTGLVATYSFANGLGYWIVGGIMIFLLPEQNGVPRGKVLMQWILMTVLVGASYFYHYQSVDFHPSPGFIFEHLWIYLSYILIYLGAPIVSYHFLGALIFGIIGLALFAVLIWKCRELKRYVIAPWMMIGSYSILSAMITGIGRTGFGPGQALSSRYITIAQLLWIAIFVMLSLVMGCQKTSSRKIPLLVLTPVLFFMTLSFFYGKERMEVRYRSIAYAQEIIRAGDRNDEVFAELYRHDPALVIQSLTTMRKLKVGMFRDRESRTNQ